ncbi:hypothetical protein JKP88DRAFT_282566 [Tribonema minus]|uniref:Uncharacterized protein n=1 Tax=Tribonema minus TaxID=303371 RepID=A0A835YMU7_9STRA|nr:hypothetical protein JKP88DRAFT_282566 [Tribonema minus]
MSKVVVRSRKKFKTTKLSKAAHGASSSSAPSGGGGAGGGAGGTTVVHAGGGGAGELAGLVSMLLSVRGDPTNVTFSRDTVAAERPVFETGVLHMHPIPNSVPAGLTAGIDAGTDPIREWATSSDRATQATQDVVRTSDAFTQSQRLIEALVTVLIEKQSSGAFTQPLLGVEDLEHVVGILNSTPNSVTGYRATDIADPLCPKSILQAIRKKLLAEANGRAFDDRFNYRLKPGDTVRIDTIALSDRLRAFKKAGRFKSSHNTTFSADTYTVQSHSDADNTVRVTELPNRVFARGQCLLIPDVKDRKQFVTEYQGKRDEKGVPVGAEDPFGYADRRVVVKDH